MTRITIYWTTEAGALIKAWTKGVQLEDQARKQFLNVAQLPFIFKWVAAMPDVHWGVGATVGSVIPTKGAIIPAAVGVDIGCGMMAVQTDLNARDLPDNLKGIRQRHRAGGAARAHESRWPWRRGRLAGDSSHNSEVWGTLKRVTTRFSRSTRSSTAGTTSNHLGTLGTGNHFHRSVPRRGGKCVVHAAQRFARCRQPHGQLLHRIGRARTCRSFSSTCRTRTWRISRKAPSISTITSKPWNGAGFCPLNRDLMMEQVVGAVRNSGEVRPFVAEVKAINCHTLRGARTPLRPETFWSPRKGAVRAREGDMGIIPEAWERDPISSVERQYGKLHEL